MCVKNIHRENKLIYETIRLRVFTSLNAFLDKFQMKREISRSTKR